MAQRHARLRTYDEIQHFYGYGYTVARNDIIKQSGQKPDKEAEIKNITVYVSLYTETDTTRMLSISLQSCRFQCRR